MNKVRFFRTLPFFLSLLLMAVMAVGTFEEKNHGNAYAYEQIYGAGWFSFLWFSMAVLAVFAIVKGKMHRNISLLLLHLSFLVILAGALLTKLFSEQAYVNLAPGVACKNMYNEKGFAGSLPFEMKLDTFYVTYYTGTNAPLDYTSEFHIIDKANASISKAQVSMNKIFSYKGYRFYQSSFDDEQRTTMLSVNRDVWGIPVTYTGYALFLLASIAFLFGPTGIFRKLLAKRQKTQVLSFLLFALPIFSLNAQTLTSDSLTVNRSLASEFGELCILHNDRVMPVSSFAHDFTLKLTGKDHVGRYNAEQFLMGLLFFPQRWQHIALFEVKDRQLQQELNASSQKAAISDFYDNENGYKLEKYWKGITAQGTKSAMLKEAEKLNEKIQLITMLHSGSLLKIYPIKGSHLKWYYPTQNMRLPNEQRYVGFLRNSLLNYYRALLSGNADLARAELDSIKRFQTDNAGTVLPSVTKRRIERFYLRADLSARLFKLNLTAGILFLLLLFSQKNGFASRWAGYVILFSLLLHTLSLALRTYIGGRLPFSNGFETMLLIAWCAMLLSVIFRTRAAMVPVFGLLISGTALLVAHLGMMNPQITPLVPVLASPLLSIHVSVIMLAYTLLAFVALNSLFAILQFVFAKPTPSSFVRLQESQTDSLICLYPATLLLGIGIFIGAVWANVSWGRYWGWDPKEVWALICFLTYLLPLHQQSLRLFSNPYFFHLFGLFSFSTVLMTYFGVNYFLGGMHSYAGEADLKNVSVSIAAIAIPLLLLATLGHWKYRKNKPLMQCQERCVENE